MRAKPLRCDEMGMALAELAFDYAKSGIVPIDSVVAQMRKDLPDLVDHLTRENVVDSINGYLLENRKGKISEEQKLRAKLVSEAKGDRAARELLDRLEKAIASVPHEPLTKRERRKAAKAMVELRAIQRETMKLLAAKERVIELEQKKAMGDLSTKTIRVQGPKTELIARRDALNKELAQLRGDDKRRGTIQSEIDRINEELQSGRFKDKPDRQTRERPADIQEAQKRLDELRKERRKAIGPDIEARNKRLDEQITELQRQIREGDFPPPKDKVQGPKEERVAERDRLRRLAKLTETNIELARQLAQKDFPGPRAKNEILDKDIEKAVFTRDRLRAKIKRSLEAEKPWTMRDILLGIPNALFKPLQTMWDSSYALRQGATALAQGRVKVAWRSFMAQFKAIKSDQHLAALNERMEAEDPVLWARMMKANNSLIASHAEEFESRISNLIRDYAPGAAYSDRVFTAAGNKARWELVKAFNKSFDGMTKEEFAWMTELVGTMTLRGKIDPYLASKLNDAFFSARALKARFNWLLLKPIRSAPTMRTKIFAFKQYLRFLAGASLLLILGRALGFGGSDDPRSSDFLKLKIGNVRLDLFGGLTSIINLMARTVTGETVPVSGKNAGKVVSLTEGNWGAREMSDVWFDFATTKLSPALSLYVEAGRRKEYGGAPFDVRRALLKRIIPMTAQDSYELLESEGWSKGFIFTMFAFFGAGARSYQEDEFGQGEGLPNHIIRLLGGEPRQAKQKKR